MNYLFSHFLIFFYVYSVKFIFLPLGTRVILGVMGFLLVSFNLLRRYSNLSVELKYLKYLFSLILLIPISILSNVINSTDDYEFVRYVVSIIVINLAAYFVVHVLIKLNPKLNFENLAYIVVNAVLFQSLLAMLMFLSLPFKDFIYSLQSISVGDIEKLNKVNEFRLIGFGSYFFGAGVIHGFALILIAACLVNGNSISKKFNLLFALKFVIVLSVGMMMARTTIIGAFLAFALLLTPQKPFSCIFNFDLFRTKFKFVFYSLALPLLLMILLYITIPQMGNLFEPLFYFVFEAFINYFESNSFESESTNHLMKMYVFPDEFSTWMIGDGLWTAINGVDYYMGSDVGYVRLLFYFGLLGTFIYLITHFYLIKSVFGQISNLLFLIFSLYFIALNLKGFTDLTPLVLIFWFLMVLKNKLVTHA